MKCIICHKNKSNDEFYRRNSIYKSCNVCSNKSILRRLNIKKSHEEEIQVDEPVINNIITDNTRFVLEPEPEIIIQDDQIVYEQLEQKGINTISWGFNGLAPKLAKGKGLSFVGAPTVKAGKYLVKITKGGEVYTQEIEVQYDPTSSFTLAERTEQQKVTKELFDLIQDLAYFVYQIDQWDEKVEEFQKKNSAPNCCRCFDVLQSSVLAWQGKPNQIIKIQQACVVVPKI